jgi:hypothetical protein
VVPPYSMVEAPAGPAYLLGFLRQQGCSDFAFCDLRLGVPDVYAPTYSHTGPFGQSYVMDVPDLPLVLALLRSVEQGTSFAAQLDTVVNTYCQERGLSPAYLSSYLTLLDLYLESATRAFRDVRFVGCSVWTSNFLATLMFAAHLKRRSHPPLIVAGGPQVTESRAAAALALRSRLVDVVVVGEGEATLLDVYDHARGSTLATDAPLAGTLTLDATGVVRQGLPRPLLRAEAIAIPAFDQMMLLSYGGQRKRTLPFHLSRGCTDKCTFCSEWVFWQRFRPGAADLAIAGVKQLGRDYGAEYIAFTDSLVNGHPARLREFAEGMLASGLKIEWGGFMRAQMDPDTAVLLRRAGCDTVFVGIESMSDDTLHLMNKRRTEVANTEALRAFLNADIRVVAGCIPGFPGDSRDAFIHTLQRLRELQAEHPRGLRINVEPFVLSPGQPLFRDLAGADLSGSLWPEEVLDLAPSVRDITQGILCTVEGNNQGAERQGRLKLVEGLQSDEAISNDVFDYRGTEEVTTTEFDFEHLTGGWFLARAKGARGHIYGVIVDEAEKDDLDDWVDDLDGADLWSEPAFQVFLRRIERRHVLGPRRDAEVALGGYRRDRAGQAAYRTTPLIVARRGDWRASHRLLLADYVSVVWWAVPGWQEAPLRALANGPHTVTSLARRMARSRPRRSHAQWQRLVGQLSELGIVTTCDPPPAGVQMTSGKR